MWRLLPLLLLCACASTQPAVDYAKTQYRKDCTKRYFRPGFKCQFYADWRLARCGPMLPLACREVEEEEQT
jgi:hypothetical protein